MDTLQTEVKHYNLTRQCKETFEAVLLIVKEKRYKVIETQDLLLAAVSTNDTGAAYALGRYSLTKSKVKDEIVSAEMVETRDKFEAQKNDKLHEVSEYQAKKMRNKHIKSHPVQLIQEQNSHHLIDYMSDYPVSEDLLKILQFAEEMREQVKPNGGIDTYWILMGIAQEEQSNAHKIVEKLMLKYAHMYDGDGLTNSFEFGSHKFSNYYDGRAEEEERDKQIKENRLSNKLNNPDYSILNDIATDITEKARHKEFMPVINRDDEIRHMEIALTRRDKNNVVLLGEGGVGKSAIVEGLALKIVNHEIPSLEGKKILQFNMNDLISVISGDSGRAIQRFMFEMKKEKNVLLFIDEIHMLGRSKSLTDTLKPAMARGDFRIIGATTPREWLYYMGNDPALVRRFEKVTVEEPSIESAIEILNQAILPYESFHQVNYDAEAIEFAVRKGKQYFPKEQLPDLAFTILDNAGAICRIEEGNMVELNEQYNQRLQALKTKLEEAKQIEFNEASINQIREEMETLQTTYNQQRAHSRQKDYNKRVTKADIKAAIEQKLGETLEDDVLLDKNMQHERLRRLKENMQRKIIGQDEAVEKVSNAVLRSKLGFKKPNRPIGVFMFLGTTGVGKTETAKVLTEELYKDTKHMIRFDMSEYQQEHEVSKLIGAPPGYVGYDKAGLLTNAVKENPQSVILFDEIEKAHVKIFDTLLQVFDDGRLTDAMGMTVDFSDTIIILTSNIGASDIRSRKVVGFGETVNSELDYDNVETTVKEALFNYFRPEFLNRIDELITFRPFEQAQILKITQLLLAEEIELIGEQGYKVVISDKATKFIANACYDPKNGARPIKRGITKLIEDNLIDKILSGELEDGGTIFIDVDNENEITITVSDPNDE
ncbi:ATP-dependent Clp protease ATP-binding subunit [Staphylococcus condimenti]|uniref:ATP-dependent Clp protease ATP-binding subunit n=1 Tax=Staphylococcus condimenti TaxID=70255 RepID=A0A4V2DWF2_9STAP|nr:ATP-dependent Clp protease ATP-binding subunit [Staphylococcus condimenti]RZI01760.1 ATP-dependent Clp protease ATP-binding subunit [Staphylococcus condimenti]RZI02936.1 ATP-dependent Clp protease ATP-binding subunit [Staphylococcus condimenti]